MSVILTTNCNNKESNMEKAWYYQHKGNATIGFGITLNGAHYEFPFPRKWTELVPDLRINRQGLPMIMKITTTWQATLEEDYKSLIPQLYEEKSPVLIKIGEEDLTLLLSGWYRLVAIWLHSNCCQSMSLFDLDTQAQFWEKFLSTVWKHEDKPGFSFGPSNSEDHSRDIAGITVEVLSKTSESVAILGATRIVPQLFPYLKIGMDVVKEWQNKDEFKKEPYEENARS